MAILSPLSHAVFFIALLGGPRFLSEYEELDIGTGKLFSKGWSQADRVRVGDSLPQMLQRVEARLERRLGNLFTTVLVPNRSELRRVAEHLGAKLHAPERVLGVAFPGLNFLMIREGLLPGTSSFRVTLVHEVAHLVIHRNPAAVVPRWFDEGVAMWVSEATILPTDEAYLSFLARLGALYPLEKLEYRFPRGEQTTSISYRQSLLLITYLVERLGPEVVPRLLDLFEARTPGTEALQEVTGMPLAELEEKFGLWVAARHSLLTAIASMVNIWTVCSLLALVAIARHMLRRRRRMRELELEDEMEDQAEEDSLLVGPGGEPETPA